MVRVDEHGRRWGALVGSVPLLPRVLLGAACGWWSEPAGDDGAPRGGAGASNGVAPGGGGGGGGGVHAPATLPAPGDRVFGDDSVIELHLTLEPADLTLI